MDIEKKVEKTLTKIVEKFSSTVVAYENGLKSVDQLKKNACDAFAKLKTLEEVDNVKVGELIDDFVAILKKEGKDINAAAESVIGKLYDWINQKHGK